jgi:CRP-like cAMP-binding protein
MSKKPSAIKAARKHALSAKTKALAAFTLAQKIGYLQVADLSETGIFDSLPIQSFNPNRILRCKDEELYLVKSGSVEIWHTQHDYLTKELEAGVLFGEMRLLGQTMLGTQAISGKAGATIATMDINTAREWVKAAPIPILEILGSRLSSVEVEHYRAGFQLADSKVAALLLELAGTGSTIRGFNHSELGEKIGVYRETVTGILNAMKLDKIVEVGRRRVEILDKKVLRELAEM